MRPIIVEGGKYDLDSLERLVGTQPREQHGQGVTLEGIFRTRSGRILVVTDSLWDNGRNEATGITGHFADSDEIAWLAERYGGPLLELVPEGD